MVGVFAIKLIPGETYWIFLNVLTTNVNHPNIKINPTTTYGHIKKDLGGGWISGTGSFTFQEIGEAGADCLTDDQKQVIKDQLKTFCGCCNGCEDLPQHSIAN